MTAHKALPEELLAELLKAHTIIRNALDVMVPEQKREWKSRNRSYSLIDRDPIRATERRRLIRQAEVKQIAATDMSGNKAINDVIAERYRQIFVEGFTHELDDQRDPKDLVLAGSAYAINAATTLGGYLIAPNFIPGQWPFPRLWWKPKTPREDLIRAAALLIAAIEHIDRNT